MDEKYDSINYMEKSFALHLLTATLASSFASNCKTIMENSTLNSDGSLTVPPKYVELLKANPSELPESFIKLPEDIQEQYRHSAKVYLNLINPLKYDFKVTLD